MTTAATILEELLGEMPLSTFLDQHYYRLPLVRTVDGRDFAKLADWETIGHLLASLDIDLIVGRDGQQLPGPPPPTVTQARGLIGQGHTLEFVMASDTIRF